MSEPLHFKTYKEFHTWLSINYTKQEGFWILFSKSKKADCMKASEALEEALCFGWIDGLMKRIDDDSYVKYFSARRKNSKWSEKNKSLVEKLEKNGRMTEYGRAKIEEAKKNGQWNQSMLSANILEEQMKILLDILKGNKVAYTNFTNMSPSIRKTYTRAYFDAKTDKGRKVRLAWIIERVEKNLKPM